METHNYIPDYLLAYLHGDATEEQQALVTEWLKDDENAEAFRQMKKIDSLTSDLSLLRQFDIQKGKRRVSRKYRANKIVSISVWVQRIAAVLFIPVLLGGIWYYQKQDRLRKDLAVLMVTQEIITQPGTKTHLFLPDSTEVWLNASSSLRFPSAFVGNERRIGLEGEAIFKVYKNKKKPFVVSTSAMDVEAVGTEFNVSAYRGDLKFSTTLAEGKVKITDRLKSDKVMFLDPGAQLNYDTKSKTYKAENVRVQDVIAWRDGVLIFNETPFYEVVARLGRWFNADIQIDDQSIANYRFTGTFTSESLGQVMELLTLSTPIAYSSSKRKVLDNRSFSKQEIRIWKNPNTPNNH
jgi:ferric-dicitrate binding protein FerR (iron transport regulator)